MRRLNNNQVQFRSREASPVTYQVGIPLVEMFLASLGISVLAGVLANLGGAGLAGAAKMGGVVFVLLAAILLALRFGRAVLYGIEGLTGQDLDKDGVVGEPEHDHHFVYVRGTPGRNSELDDLRDFTQGVYSKGTGRRGSVGSRLATTGHTVTRGMYDRFCGVLLQAGILEDLGEGRGTELTCSLDEALDTLDLA